MVLVVPGCKVEPPARVNSKKVHLTYAGLWPGELTHASILSDARNWAQTRHGLREYLIGCEKHVDPTIPGRDEHFHVYLHFGKAVDLPDWQRSTSFDLHGRNGRCLHPQIQQVGRSAADRERVIRYGMKEGDYAGEIDPPLAVDPGRDEASEDEEDEDDNDDGNKGPAWASMLNRATTVQQGMQLLAAQAPSVYYLNGGRIEPMLEKRIGSPTTQLYDLTDFNRPPLNLDQPVVLFGSTDCGKTAFAKAHFKQPLMVKRRDDLKRMGGLCDGIIFDDVDFSSWSAEDTICLLDMDESRSLPARYSDAWIEADIPMIFTTNKKPKKMFARIKDRRQRAAVKRRYVSVEVTGPLQSIGRPFTPSEKRARREAGTNGPQRP